MITAEQKARWETFGFLMLRQLFAPDEVNVVRETAIRGRQPTAAAVTLSHATPVLPPGAFMERHPARDHLGAPAPPSQVELGQQLTKLPDKDVDGLGDGRRRDVV